MKKLLLSTFLGLATLALTPALSQAGTFGLFTGCSWFGCGCGACNCTYTVRPYNAFTPVCCGNITCMGCMPFACPYPNYGGMGYCGPQTGYPVPDGETMVPYESSSNCGTATPAPTAQAPALPPLPPLPGEFTKQQQPAVPYQILPLPMQQPLAPVPGLSSQAPNATGTIQAGYRTTVPQMTYPYGYYGIYGTTSATPYYWNAK